MGFIMAKKTDTASAVEVQFKDLEDLGYQQAGNYESTQNMAKFAMAQIPDFPESIDDEARSKLYSGYRRRYNQLNPAVVYAVINDHYVLATEEQKTQKIELVNIGVDYAFSFSSQEFGKLANTNPNLHEIIKKIRDKTGTYCSNRLNDLKREAKKILNQGKERKRTANKNFNEYVDAFFTEAFDRLKSAKSRGDTTADEKRFNAAKVAFMVAWKHGQP
jgi:hypothetical protein